MGEAGKLGLDVRPRCSELTQNITRGKVQEKGLKGKQQVKLGVGTLKARWPRGKVLGSGVMWAECHPSSATY